MREDGKNFEYVLLMIFDLIIAGWKGMAACKAPTMLMIRADICSDLIGLFIGGLDNGLVAFKAHTGL